jgi:putative intracellular protease/amidase
MPARVLILLPARDFDPSEAAVSWQVLTRAGHVVSFATPDGRPAVADDMMLTGRGLDFWGAVPLLRNLPLIGLLARANRDARQAHAAMNIDPHYRAPRRWDDVDPLAFDALLLPGGHRARGMRDYLEGNILQRHVARFFDDEKPVAAICHGVLLAARGISTRTGRSVLHGYRTTALTWAGKPRLVARPHRQVLGSGLLSDLCGARGATDRIHVGSAGGDAGAGARRGFLRCPARRSVLSSQNVGP